MLKGWIFGLGIIIFASLQVHAESAEQQVPQSGTTFDPQAVQILKDSFQVYRDAKSYHDQVVLTVTMKGEDAKESKSQSFNSQLVFERPNKIYFVWPSVNVVCDGNVCQVSYPKYQQYLKQPSPKILTRAYLEKLLIDNLMTMVINGLVSETPYEDSMKGIDRLEYMGTDRIGDRTCDKLRLFEKNNRVTIYIDQQQKTIRELLITPVDKDAGWDLSVSYKKVELNQPVDAVKFKVVKPADMKQVDRISFTRQFDYPREGHKIPDFEIDIIGSQRKASVKSFLGKKITFVTFWATWCPPCRAELPVLEELYKTYRDKGFEVVGVNLDTDGDVETIKKMTHEMGITFPILRDARARYARELLVQNLPTLLVLDSSGKIIEAHVGSSPDIRKELGMIIEDAVASSGAGASQPAAK